MKLLDNGFPENPIDRAMVFLQLNKEGKLDLTEEQKNELQERIIKAVFKKNWLLDYIEKKK